MENNKIDMVTVIAYTDGSCKPSSDQTKSPYGGGVHGYGRHSGSGFIDPYL